MAADKKRSTLNSDELVAPEAEQSYAAKVQKLKESLDRDEVDEWLIDWMLFQIRSVQWVKHLEHLEQLGIIPKRK